MLTRISNPDKIRETLDAFMKEPEKQRAPFLATIFSREHRPGGIIYEGHRPIGAVITDDDKKYCLGTMDDGYSSTVASLHLSKIEYIETLN